MRKYHLALGTCMLTGILLLSLHLFFSAQTSFSCESQYEVTEHINQNTLHSRGLLSAEFSGNSLLINLEGLLTNNEDKYIISRSVDFTLKKIHNSNYLFHIISVRITRHSHDNIPQNVDEYPLFSNQGSGRIIYINRVDNDTILFGNQTFPQYGCKRQ